MFNQYQPTVKATISFLKLLNVKVANKTVDETLQNHPDWPGILCITDSLNKWGIPNGVGKIETDKIDELPTPFIAYTYDKENPLAIITHINSERIQFSQKDYNNPVPGLKNDFIKKWNGVYLIAEPNEDSGEVNYEATKHKSFLNSLIPFGAFIALVILSLLFLNKAVVNNNASLTKNVFGIYLQYFVLLSGVVVTSLLLWYEIDKNNPLLQKVCTGIAKGDCNAILTGKHAKVFTWLSWSEVGLFYFTGSMLLMLGIGEFPISLFVLGCVNVLALPYILFSVYYQWKVAKQWCVLCLSVQALLLLGGINVIANFIFPLPQFSPLLITNYLLLFAIPALVWFAIKPYILQLQEAKSTKREYLRTKFNTEIFEILLKRQKAISLSTDGLGIDMGNPYATNLIIKVCNPYCGPCADTHPKIEALLEQNKNVKAKIIFTTTNDESNPAIQPVRHLLAIAAENNEEKTKQALDDWYLADEKDYNAFEKKYPMNGELLKQGNKIEMMAKWCQQMDIAFTPTIFINGQQLPDAYNIADLQYFLLE